MGFSYGAEIQALANTLITCLNMEVLKLQVIVLVCHKIAVKDNICNMCNPFYGGGYAVAYFFLLCPPRPPCFVM